MYLADAFGNAIRLDYGSGHELAFVAFLACLEACGLLPGEADCAFVGAVVFGTYLGICRRLQRTFFLEPAGSHGVWGLDDYQFVPYIWGSSQLCRGAQKGGLCEEGEAVITPSEAIGQAAASRHASEYLYLQAIDHIYSVKRAGHFGEHSPLLYDISGLPTWERINEGLLRMYGAEVLSKLPIMQHLLFGRLLSWDLV